MIINSPYKNIPTSLVFFGKDAFSPIDHKTAAENLHDALVKIGISEQERKTRNIMLSVMGALLQYCNEES